MSRLSSVIIPVRIYSEYHDIEKFRKGAGDFERFELITDKTRLLPFQFRRPKSIFPIIDMWLRQECNDFYTPLLNKSDAEFINPTTWLTSPSIGIDMQKGKVVFSAGAGNFVSQNALLTIGKKYRVKIIIDEIVNDNSMSLIVENGTTFGNPAQSISSAGTHIFEFTAVDNSILIMATLTGDDYVNVTEFSVYEIVDAMDEATDYQLDVDTLEILNTEDENIISHCGSAATNTLPCGKYYIVMKSKDNDGNDEYYFSEIITIKNFVPTQSPFLMLEWFNECDIENVKYTGWDCEYKNRLYVDGAISKPEMPFDETVEEDGNKKQTAVFQKWEKTQTIFVPKSPEFIVDAITTMRLHDNIRFFDALRKNQHTIDLNEDYQNVEKMTYDTNYILNDCAANVELKVLLDGRIIDSTCCSEIELADACEACTHTVFGLCEDGYPVKLCVNEDGITYDYYENDVLADPPEVGTVICFIDETPSLMWNGSAWVHYPSLDSFTNQSTTVTVTGKIYPNTVAQIILDNGTTTYVVPGYYTAAQLLAGIVITKASTPFNFASLLLTCKIHCVQGSCDFGYSDELTLCYGGGC